MSFHPTTNKTRKPLREESTRTRNFSRHSDECLDEGQLAVSSPGDGRFQRRAGRPQSPIGDSWPLEHLQRGWHQRNAEAGRDNREDGLRMLHLVLDSQRHPYIAARPGNDGLVGRRSSVREEDIGLIDEGFPGNSFVVREPVPSWERHDQALRQQALAHQRVALDRRPKNPDMDGPALKGGNLVWGREIAQLDLDFRMSPSEEPDNSRTVEEVSPQGAAHDQLADLTAARPLHGPGGLLGLRDDRSCLSEEHSARVRQLHVTRRPMEEERLQLLLEAPNLLAQGRLTDMESRSRPSKMKFFGDGEEVAQVAQLHTGTHITNVSTMLEKYIGQWTPHIASLAPTPQAGARGSDGEDMPLFRVPSTNISASSPTTRLPLAYH